MTVVLLCRQYVLRHSVKNKLMKQNKINTIKTTKQVIDFIVTRAPAPQT